MSNSPDTDLDLNLHFLPDWAKQSPNANLYEKYAGTEETPGSRRPHRDRKPERRRRGSPADASDSHRKPKGAHKRKFSRPGKGDRKKPSPPPLPQIKIIFVADEKGVDSLARQIKMTGRAFPLFEIGQMILQKPARHSVVFSVIKKAEGPVAQPLFVCALDDTLWLSEEEAARHVLEKHFDAFYQVEKTPCDPPKGTYTFVAQCGFSGVILGPPNYHDYQNQLQKLHQERFSNMPFEKFKSRVKIVRDEEVVGKWLEEQSFKTEYICLNQPEAAKLTRWEEVENHFREVHQPNIIKQVETHTLSGEAARNAACKDIRRLVHYALDEQRRFPLKVVHVLSQQFAARGLQFFKVNKTFTHVSVARPHYLDLENNPVSEGIRKIVEFIDAHPKCNRKQLIESLAPAPQPEPGKEEPPSKTSTSSTAETKPVEEGELQTAPPSVEEAKSEAKPGEETAPVKSEEKAAEPQTAAKSEMPTPEQQAVISDLHWLIHQGHVIEFANGILETAKKPAVAPQPKRQEKPKQDSERKDATKGATTSDASVAPAEAGAHPADENIAATENEKTETPDESAEQKKLVSSASPESASKAATDSTAPDSADELISPSTNQASDNDSTAVDGDGEEKGPEKQVPTNSISSPGPPISDSNEVHEGSPGPSADSASDAPPSETPEKPFDNGNRDNKSSIDQTDGNQVSREKEESQSSEFKP